MFFLLLIFAFPSTYGGKGIYRVKSADVEYLLGARSILLLNADAEGYRYDYSDSTIDFASSRINIAYIPSRRVEFYNLWRVSGEGEAQLPLKASDFSGDLGDTDIGMKMTLIQKINSYAGVDLPLTLPIGRREYSNDQFIFYPKFLLTLDVADYTILLPLRFHLNLGIPLGRKELSQNFPLLCGFAGELPSKFFTYFIELTRNHERDWYWRFTPGMKFHPIHRVSLTAGADFGLVKDLWLIGANIGLSLNSSLLREREVLPTGNIAGEVRDKNTQEPVEAQITIIETDERIKSHPLYGVYKIIGLPQGIYTLKIEAAHYSPETRVAVVEKDKTLALNFFLSRSEVVYKGAVKDSHTEEPIIDAMVNIDGPTKISINSNDLGEFQVALSPGDYEITVNKPNYAQFKSRISIIEDRQELIFLKPIEVATEIGETPEAIVYFDLDDANIRDDQKPTLDTIAEFLKTHPRVRCELRGHTDRSGNMNYNQVLSLARANSVMDYLVKIHGIEKGRISTMAFSKTKLIKESPKKSRRVEIFLIK